MKITINQALEHLKNQFKALTVKGNYAYSSKVALSFRYSKLYIPQEIWWTGEFPERLNNSNYIIIALDSCGLLVLPSKIIRDYWTQFQVSSVKDGRKKIRIRLNNNEIELYNNSDQGVINVTQYLHKCDF